MASYLEFDNLIHFVEKSGEIILIDTGLKIPTDAEFYFEFKNNLLNTINPNLFLTVEVGTVDYDTNHLGILSGSTRALNLFGGFLSYEAAKATDIITNTGRTTGKWSFAIWHKLTGTTIPNSDRIFGITSLSGSTWATYGSSTGAFVTNNQLQFSIANESHVLQSILVYTGYTTNVWRHLAYTCDGRTKKFYLNGVETLSVDDDNPQLFGPYEGLGGNIEYFTVSTWNSAVSDFVVYNRTLSATEVLQIYNNT